jgi:ABC-2 type transport system permease protein
MSSHPLFQLSLVRMREFTREPEAVFWALLFPILLTVGLGIAFRNQPAQVVRVAVTTPQIAEALRTESLIDVQELPEAKAEQALRNGKVVLLVEPGPDGGVVGGVVYRFDDTNPDARNARMVTDRVIQRAAGRADPVPASDRLVREAGSRYIDFLVPGLVGSGIMSNAIWGTAFSIVDARRRKLLKRIVATPMPRHYYLLSHLIWRMALLALEVGVPLGFGRLAFGVPIRGSFADLILLGLVASLSFSALGLLIASRVRTIEAASGLTNLVIMPMWVLSGVFFSSDRFPNVVQPVIRALPLTAANDALRALLLQGASLGQLIPQIGVMSVWLALSFVLALKLFRWR